MESTFKDRLITFLRHEGISKSDFARSMGLSQAYISSMRRGMPPEKVAQLLELYPSLNRDWLIHGEGEMLREDEEARLSVRNSVPDIGYGRVRLVPTYAMAGALTGVSDGVMDFECEWITNQVRGAEVAIRIDGDSMEPNIKSGSVAFLKKINFEAFIPWGKPMVVDTENGTLVKVLWPCEGNDRCLVAESYNKRYPDFKVPFDSIYNIYRILYLTVPEGTY